MKKRRIVLGFIVLAILVISALALQVKNVEAASGWRQSNGGWWYEFSDGSYASNEYIGGYWLDSAGWYNSAWDGSWCSNSTGWWFQSGSWYPTSQWLRIDQKWYYFKASGYMATNEWVGNYYLQADGSMAVNKWIGDYYVGLNGEWIPSTSKNESHNHSYSPTYGTTNVQQYASDGTTNDYNKPIYGTQQVEKTREVPVYETHQVDVNGNDITAAWNNGGREEWRNSGCWNDYNDDYNNMCDWQTWKYGTLSRRKAQVQVGTTTETYYETEEIITGYEQLGTISKKTITGYTCSCGKSISAATYVSQYGTPGGYKLQNGVLVRK